jgi:hypothetical protein
VKYHVDRLAAILGLVNPPASGLCRDSATSSQKKELTDVGVALMKWLQNQPDLQREFLIP